MVSEFEDLGGPVVFRQRPAPVAGRLLPARRIALLLLSIDKCWGHRATPLQLHALDTAIINANARRALARRESDLLSTAIIRYDPALTRAIDRAVGFDLARWVSGNRLEMTDTGEAVLQGIRAAGVLLEEREALSELPTLTQRAVQEFVRGGRWL